MQSLKSSALEPTRADLAGLSRGQIVVRLLPIYGLPILTLTLIAFISLLSLAAMVPMMAGRIDLTVGFGIVMWHILAISLQVKYGIPWPVACLAVIACAGIAGLINGMLVEVAQIDSFIATLGTGTILYALALWHTEGRQVIGVLPEGFVDINGISVFGVPIPAIYAVVLALAVWVITERMPLGRHLYAIGAN